MGEPLAERIAFIQNNDTLKLNIVALAQACTTRQQVKINLDAKNPDNNPIAGSFSVSVIDESQVGIDEQTESTIINNLLLTSDLKGYIEHPNYYFTNINDRTKADLDLLMLTQGYRRFEWKQILNNTTPSITFQPDKSLEIAGTVKIPSGKPVPNSKVTLLAAKENLFRDTIADANGNFKFTDLYLADTTNVVLKARKGNDDDHVVISIKSVDYPAITATGNEDTAVALL